MTRRLLALTAGLFLAACLIAAAPKDAEKFSAEQLAFFDKQVRPLLEESCVKCHGGEKPRGGLNMSTRAALLKGGETGPAISLEKPEDSLFLKALTYELDMPKMPPKPKGQLPAEQIAVLTRWVKEGLPMPDGAVLKHTEPKVVVTEEAKNYWAYKPVRRPEPPKVKDASWVKNPIDAFLLARLEEKGLKPNSVAERVALVRRAYYDLTGLPPTPEEVDAFVNDTRSDAWEKLIDKLLASQHYGEKWGRHWLDLVRYAETNGYERDGPKPQAWRFRDYVIKSFNDDKPYDRFLKEQLAGDEIDREDPDCVIATGYYRLGLWDDEPVDPKQSRFDELDDFVATTSQVYLGMTMNCARCHDHKIDPLPQKDYYSLLAFFLDVQHYSNTRDVRSSFNLTDISPREKRKVYEEELKQREARLAELKKEMEKIEDEAIKKMPAEDQRAAEGNDRPEVLKKVPGFLTEEQRAAYGKLRTEVSNLSKKPEPPGRELALSVNNCLVNPPEAHVMIRGGPHSPGAKVEPSFPEVLGFPAPKIPAPKKDARSSGRRTVLASWIASKDNPLTARVLVNRLWQHHFGRGIVTSTNDFGKFGTPPTHPELLDWLADEFMKGDWKIKRMHKLLMTSAAYRMSSTGRAEALRTDPENQLFWRFSMRRLTAEEVRDSFLAVSGKLSPRMGGPSVYPPIPREVLAGQSRPGEGWGKATPEEASRRSVYAHVKRSLLVPILTQHDQADTDSSCPVRYTTVVPTQALGMLNGDFSHEQAGFLAERVRKEAPDDLAKQVRRAIRLTTGRTPGEDEVKKDVEFVEGMRTKAQLDAPAAMKQYCLMLLNTNEFIYLD